MQQPTDNQLPLSRIQALIGRLMAESKRECPSFYMETFADLTALLEMRKPYCKRVGVRVSTNDFFFCAMARAIRRFPLMAGKPTPDNGHIQISPTIGIGFAVAAPQGLVVPVLQDVGDKPLVQISMESNALLKKARSNKLVPDDFYGANVVLSGLGMYGVHGFYAIAPPASTGILSLGNINDTIVPTEEGHLVRKTMSVSLAADARVVDEVYAARFLRCVVEQLEDPVELTHP